MATVNEANVEKKLQNVTNTQDSIQTLSLWFLHHKAHCEKIVDIWFKILKKSKTQHRLTLMYLCNDVVQNSKKKHAIMYKDAFKEVLQEAVLLVREGTIRPKIERIFKIWGERGIYDKEFIKDLIETINNSKVTAAATSKLLAEFKPEEAIEKILSLKKFEDENEQKRKQLKNIRVDASSVEAIKQLKDRSHGKEFCQQFEDSCVQLEEYVQNLEKEIADRTAQVENLEQAELFYDAQYGEVKLVANAYKNFGTRVNNQKKKLTEKINTVLELLSPSPVPSPSIDAPSPGNTPPPDPTLDNTEVEDMDMSDEETHSHVRRTSQHESGTSTTKSIPQPISSVTQIQMRASTKRYLLEADNSPKSLDSAPSPDGTPELELTPKQDGKGEEDETKIKSVSATKAFTGGPGFVLNPQGGTGKIQINIDPRQRKTSNQQTDPWNEGSQSETSTPPQPIETVGGSKQGATIPVIQSASTVPDGDLGSGGSTPLNDEMGEGGATPVQDEKPDEVLTPRQNPIEFLTQLITQTKKGAGTSSSFMHSLSLLTSPKPDKAESTPQQQLPEAMEQTGFGPPPPPPVGGLNPTPQFPHQMGPSQPGYTPPPTVASQAQPFTPGPPGQQPGFSMGPPGPDQTVSTGLQPPPLPPLTGQHPPPFNSVPNQPGPGPFPQRPPIGAPPNLQMNNQVATFPPGPVMSNAPYPQPQSKPIPSSSMGGAVVQRPPMGHGPPMNSPQPMGHEPHLSHPPMQPNKPPPLMGNIPPRFPGPNNLSPPPQPPLMAPFSHNKPPPQPRGILKNVRPNLTTIQTVDTLVPTTPSVGESGSSIPTVGANVRPPSHPPAGGFRTQTHLSEVDKEAAVAQDQKEFIEKLKRKTNTPSPTNAPANPMFGAGLRRNSNLTELPREDSSDKKNDEKGESKAESPSASAGKSMHQGGPISTVKRVDRDKDRDRERDRPYPPWKHDPRDRRDSGERERYMRERDRDRDPRRPVSPRTSSFYDYAAARGRELFLRDHFPPPPPPMWPPHRH